MHKRKPTHGSGGEWSISTKRSRSRSIVRSRIVIHESICVQSGSFLSANTLGGRRNRALWLSKENVVEGEQAAVELVYQIIAGNRGDSLET